MDLELNGRVALITGGSRGIGFGVASVLRREGMDLVLLARSEGDLKAAAEKLQSQDGKGKVGTIVADVSSADSVESAFDTCVSQYGAPHLVVNNAGPPMAAAPIAEADDDAWANVINTKAMGFIRVGRAALKRLQPGSSIVSVSGITTKVVIPNAGITGFVNAGVHALTAYLADEGSARGIRANAVCPGLIHTDQWEKRAAAIGENTNRSGPEVMADMQRARAVMVDRWGTPEEVGETVAFLASARAAYITGQAISVDGGVRPSLA